MTKIACTILEIDPAGRRLAVRFFHPETPAVFVPGNIHEPIWYGRPLDFSDPDEITAFLADYGERYYGGETSPPGASGLIGQTLTLGGS